MCPIFFISSFFLFFDNFASSEFFFLVIHLVYILSVVFMVYISCEPRSFLVKNNIYNFDIEYSLKISYSFVYFYVNDKV